MYIINVCFNVQGVVALVGRFATFAPVRFSEAKFYLYHSTRGWGKNYINVFKSGGNILG